MSQEPNAQEPTTNDALSEDQLDKVAGGVLFSMGEETTSTGFDSQIASTTTTTTTTSTSGTNLYIDPTKLPNYRTPTGTTDTRIDLTAESTTTFTDPAANFYSTTTTALQNLRNSM